MLAMLETNQAALDRATRDSVDTLSGRIAEIEATIDRLAARLGDQQATSEALLGGLGDGSGPLETRLAALHSHGVATDRKSVAYGKRVSERVEHRGRRQIKIKKNKKKNI